MYFVDFEERNDGLWFAMFHLSDSGEKIQDTPFLFEAKNAVQSLCDFYNSMYDLSKSILNNYKEDSSL